MPTRTIASAVTQCACIPQTISAREAKAFLEDSRANAHIHAWSIANTLLFSNNRKALHGPEAVKEALEVGKRVIERASYFDQ